MSRMVTDEMDGSKYEADACDCGDDHEHDPTCSDCHGTGWIPTHKPGSAWAKRLSKLFSWVTVAVYVAFPTAWLWTGFKAAGFNGVMLLLVPFICCYQLGWHRRRTRWQRELDRKLEEFDQFMDNHEQLLKLNDGCEVCDQLAKDAKEGT